MNKQISLTVRACVSVITVILMVTAAFVTGEKEIIFPEIAALTVGAFISDKLPWRTGMVRMLLLMTLGAFIGYGLSVYSPFPLYVNIIAAFTVCIIILSIAKSTMLPMISAAVLPVLTNVQSLVYPVSVLLLTLTVIEIRQLMLYYGVIEKTEFSDEVPRSREEIARRIWLITVFAILAAAAVISGMTFIIAPPLAVILAEAAQRDTPVRKDPFGFFLCTILCAFAGTASRMVLCDLFGLNMITGVGTAAASAVFFLIMFKKPFPPAAALAVLPFILPESVIAVYPFQVVTGCAAVISLDMIYQKAMDKDIPVKTVNKMINFILSLQILPPERHHVKAETEEKNNQTANDREILPPSPDDNNITAVCAADKTEIILPEETHDTDNAPQQNEIKNIREETGAEPEKVSEISEEESDVLLQSMPESEIISTEPSDDSFSFTLPAIEEKTPPAFLKFEDEYENENENENNINPVNTVEYPKPYKISFEDEPEEEKTRNDNLPQRKSIFDKLKAFKKPEILSKKPIETEKNEQSPETIDPKEENPVQTQKNVRRRL